MQRIRFEHLCTEEGWVSPCYAEISDGRFVSLQPEPPTGWQSDEAIAGFALPALPNLHSHAFQRALVGRGERRGPAGADSFWTWREAMYRLACRVDPDDLEAIATFLYVEMLEAGYGAVGEFHYLHHRPDGRPYADAAEMSRRILAAAERTGIALTLLPVLYLRGGFDSEPSGPQLRFVHRDVDAYLRLVDALAESGRARIGLAPHSLRAVHEAGLRAVVAAAQNRPLHIHIAEQVKEVEECLTHCGARPVAWLLDRFSVGPNWCLVHATHMEADETRRVAECGAVVGLCPTTEANLGDGIFPLLAYREAGGRFGIGSDSQTAVSPAAELVLLEYGQRLVHRRRNLVAGPHPSVGRTLLGEAVRGGAQALGQPISFPRRGAAADLVVLDASHPRLLGHDAQSVLDAWIFGAAEGAVSQVMVGGRWVVREGRHPLAETARQAFERVMHRLWREA
ncbi:MAG: formimidoylglutamate deiminase [Deltaproteobacteria bacterium]|nr:MAG: formimidoylglutamate deiminase [Deltaproteobacteria bacterium]